MQASRRWWIGAVMVLMAVVAAAAIVVTVLLATGPAYDDGGAGEGMIVTVAYSLIFCVVGSFLAAKRPDNLVGWSMMFSGGGILVGSLFSGYAEYVLLAHPGADAPLALEAASIGAASWTFLMSGIFFLLVLFPTGKPSSKRWALVAKIVAGGFIVIWFTIATAPVDYETPFEGFGRNKLAFHDFEVLVGAIFAVIFPCLLAILAAAINLFIRFWKSRGQERQQFKWLAISAILLGVSIPFSGTSTGILSDISGVAFGIGLFTIPISVGIAVMRYHLYDIDRIINRTLVYALLTAVLGAFYMGAVVGLQSLLNTLSGGNDLAIVITTLVVAALFLPARRAVQGIVDRRFNRRVYDAQRSIDAFSARLRDQIDLDTLRYELLTVVNETVEPSRMMLVWTKQVGQ